MSSPPSDDSVEVAQDTQERRGFSRRRLIGAAGVTAAMVGAAGAGALAGSCIGCCRVRDIHRPTPFRGERQAGIITPQQDRMHFCAFDVTTDSRDAVVSMLREWTQMSERMTAGQETVPNGALENPYGAPSDTGEALDLPPSALTLTVGFGPSFFIKDGKDRFGIADQRPAGLADLPKFTNETMDPARSGGDICVQACANDHRPADSQAPSSRAQPRTRPVARTRRPRPFCVVHGLPTELPRAQERFTVPARTSPRSRCRGGTSGQRSDVSPASASRTSAERSAIASASPACSVGARRSSVDPKHIATPFFGVQREAAVGSGSESAFA